MPLAELTIAGNGDLFSVRKFSVRESLSDLFGVRVWALSPEDAPNLEALVGARASLRLDLGEAHGRAPGTGTRTWTGICNSIEQLEAEPTGLSSYYLCVVPDLWLLTQRTNHRIFQHKTVPAIIDALLQGWNLEGKWEVASASCPSLEYRVQYGETDYAFFSRMLEEAGITFFFDGASGASDLVFSDALHRREPRSGSPLQYLDKPNATLGFEYLTRLRLAREVRPGAVTLREPDFRRPGFELGGEAQRIPGPEGEYEQYRFTPGAFVVEGGAAEMPVGDVKSVARRQKSAGEAYAQRSLEALRAGHRSLAFDANTIHLAPGTVLAIKEHPHPDLDGHPVLVTELAIDGGPQDEWTTSGRASFTDAPHRPAQKSRRPVVAGVQTAKVVGDGEIATDELGRVRVQLFWDREGQNDDNSSSWLRVSEGWAGTGFGIVALPRVGQEVLVGFFDGNPDQPVVVGRVFNAVNQVPYPLPANKTRSTWKSRSTPNGSGFNELMFEDLAGSELVFEQAERDRRELVKNDEAVTVGHDRKKLVKGDETEITGATRWEAVGGDRFERTSGDRTTVIAGKHDKLVGLDQQERIEGDYLLYVGQDQHVLVNDEKRESIGKDSHLRVKGSRNEQIGGSRSLSAGAHHESVAGKYLLRVKELLHMKAGTQVVLQGVASLTLKAPGGFIQIGAGGIVIEGTQVKINCGASAPDAIDAKPAGPLPPREAEVTPPPPPVPDDVSLDPLGH